MTTLLKIFLPIYFLLFFGLAMFWRSYIAWKRTGINPYKLGNGDTVHDFVGKLFRLTLIVAALIVFVFSFLEGYYHWLSPIIWMNSSMLIIIGIALLVLALIWVLVAQLQMGDSWRIGIDEKSESALVQHGLFGVSRNPIFLGMLVMLVGLLLILPTAATLTVSALGFVLIHVQVRLEEDFLAEKYGENYRKYQMSVRRWI
ncbi:MAG TPA: isoprenylcysteine carboxylmethyltransferase family protein [Anaerolineales bacterium]|jgi:protein-S-isoprenylcysteine O-methyltransferase Ste14|nr:isoprenylcysteine carboxylmethyltransferase family protein [Anaerolineales bacterium]HNO92670.1 isoprenylcysteine carboxylmethyltransferase family protein [Anaerolineales bacterium]